MREQDTGQRGGSGRTLIFIFFKAINLATYKQRAYILALEYTDQVGYMKM